MIAGGCADIVFDIEIDCEAQKRARMTPRFGSCGIFGFWVAPRGVGCR